MLRCFLKILLKEVPIRDVCCGEKEYPSGSRKQMTQIVRVRCYVYGDPGMGAPADCDVWKMVKADLDPASTSAMRFLTRSAWDNWAESTQRMTRGQLDQLHASGNTATPFGLANFVCGVKREVPLAEGKIGIMVQALSRAARSVGVTYPTGVWGRMKLALSGYLRNNPQPIKQRGAISIEQFQRILEVNKASGDAAWEMHRDAMIILYAFALRTSQMKTVKRRMFILEQDKAWIYVGPRFKYYEPSVSCTTLETHTAMDALDAEVTRIMAAHADDNKLVTMFPGYNPATVNNVIKATAAQFEWNHLLSWCSHGLRHGSITEAVEEGGLEGGFERGSHLTAVSVGRYSAPLAERLEKSLNDSTKKRGRPAKGSELYLAAAAKKELFATAAQKIAKEKTAKRSLPATRSTKQHPRFSSLLGASSTAAPLPKAPKASTAKRRFGFVSLLESGTPTPQPSIEETATRRWVVQRELPSSTSASRRAAKKENGSGSTCATGLQANRVYRIGGAVVTRAQLGQMLAERFRQ